MRQHFRHDPRRDELPVRFREQIAAAKLTQAFGEFHARTNAVGQIAWPFMATAVEIKPERQIITQMTAEFDQHGGFWQPRLGFHRQQAKPCAADKARIPVPHAMKRMAAPTLRPALVVNICHQTKKRPFDVMALLRRQEIPQPIVAEGQCANIKCSRVIESKTQLRHIDGQRTRHVHQAFRGVAAVPFIASQQSDGRQHFYRADGRNERPFETAALLMLRQPFLRLERQDFAERIVRVERLQIAVGVAQKVFITGLRIAAGRRLRLNLLQKIAMQKKPRMNAFRRQLLFAYQQAVIPLPPHAPLQFRRLLLPHDGQRIEFDNRFVINEIVDAELKPIVRRKQRRLQTGHACVPFGRERRKRQIEFNPFAVAFIQFAELLLVVFLLFAFFMGDQNIDENVAELAASVTAIDARIVRVVFNRRQIVLKPAELEFLCRQRHRKKILVCR